MVKFAYMSTIPQSEIPGMHSNSYFERLLTSLLENQDFIEGFAVSLANLMIDTWNIGGTVFVLGNGGSDSSAQHFVIDCLSIKQNFDFPIRVEALSSNTSVITAIANDLGYDQIFSRQLEKKLKESDLCLFISASGNSQNLLRACEVAERVSAKTVALIGFDGGVLAEEVDHLLHIKTQFGEYGISEDIHLSVLHATAEEIRNKGMDDIVKT